MPGENSAFLGVIFVLYRDYDSFEKLIRSQRELPRDLHIVVVDNSEPEFAHPQHLEELQKYFCIEVIVASDNPGYFGAANRAFELSSQLREGKWVCLSNVDLDVDLLSIYDFLQSSRLSSELAIGAIAPMVRTSSGATMRQPHFLRMPSERKFRHLSKVFRIYWLAVAQRLISDISQRVNFERFSSGLEPGQLLFAPHGAFLILSQRYFETTAGFRYSAFLFGEEIHVGLECLNAKLSCIYAPEISYNHSRHGSIGKIPTRRAIKYLADAHRTLAIRIGAARATKEER